jgi:hypothetical protein
MPDHHDAKQLAPRGRDWIAARNSQRSGAHPGALHRGPRDDLGCIIASGLDASGTLRGEERLRKYWGKAFVVLPDLHFELIDTYVSPDSIVVFYQNERGARICEYLRIDAAGKIKQGSANHLAH